MVTCLIVILHKFFYIFHNVVDFSTFLLALNVILLVDTIQNVASIQQIHDKILNLSNANLAKTVDRHFAILVFATVTQLDLDGLGTNMSKRW